MQNDGDLKIVVGNNFDDIVLDESKDVLLEVLIKTNIEPLPSSRTNLQQAC